MKSHSSTGETAGSLAWSVSTPGLLVQRNIGVAWIVGFYRLTPNLKPLRKN
jgi:hypothetical protein